jgi:hypothetical protein
MSDHERDHDEEEMTVTNRGRGADSTSEKNTNVIPEIPFCGCISVQFYQPYFDLDTADVISRISSAMFYCRREENFLNLMKDKPDAYGPFWIATTLVFTVAVTSHINSWLLSWMSGKTWVYDFQSIVSALSLIYGFAAGVPVGNIYVYMYVYIYIYIYLYI